jgi:hypothetical protein
MTDATNDRHEVWANCRAASPTEGVLIMYNIIFIDGDYLSLT